MIISDISIQNFRSFKEKCNLNDIKRLNVFVGPNMAGKSNIFEALKLLKSLAYHGEQSKFIENIFDRMQRSEVEISLTMSLSDIERREIIKPLLKRYPNLFSGTDIKKNNFFRHIRYCVSISKNVISGVRVNGEVTEEQLHVSAPNMDYVLVLHHKVSSDGHPSRYFCDIEKQFLELSVE